MPASAAINTQHRSLRRGFVLILCLISILVYANSFTNGFVLDDLSSITQNSYVTRGVSAIPDIFITPYLRGFTYNPNDLYRPLSLAMFATEYQVFGGSPMGSHIINMLFFTGCVVLLFSCLDILFERKKTITVFIAATLFALHPLHTEVVANIKSRDELLCFFFVFLAFWLFLQYIFTGRKIFFIAGTLAYFLSLLGKETSITFLLIFPVIFFRCYSEEKKRGIRITAAIFVTAIIYLTIRFSILHYWQSDKDFFKHSFEDNFLYGAPNASIRIATAILILGKYIKMLFIPYPLVCDYSYNTIPLTNFADPWVLLSIAVYAGLILIGFYRFFKIKRDLIAFAIMFYLVTLTIFSNLFVPIGAAVGERFMFFPSVGFCILAGEGIYRLCARAGQDPIIALKKRISVVLAVIAVIYGTIVVNRNKDWRNGIVLYKKDLTHNPNSFRLHTYLGFTLVRSSEKETDPVAKDSILREGIAYLKKALVIYPGFAIPNSQIGLVYTNLKQYDSAERYDLRAIQLNPKDTFTMNNLAGAYFKTGKYRNAIEYSRRILEIRPDYSRGYRNIGSCYLKMGNNDSAVIALKKSIELDPDVSSAYYYLSVAYQQKGIIDSAKKYEAIAHSF